MNADTVVKHIDSRNARLDIRAGKKGTGKVLWSCDYWPWSVRSVEAAYDMAASWAARNGVTLTQHDPDEDDAS